MLLGRSCVTLIGRCFRSIHRVRGCSLGRTQALEAGETLGITLYQGHLLDEMLARNVTRQDKVEALTDALTRHRATSR